MLFLTFCALTLVHGKDWGPLLERPPITIRFDYDGWYFTNTSKETLYAVMIQADDIPYFRKPDLYKTPRVIIDSIEAGKTVRYWVGVRKGTTVNFTAKDYSKPLPVTE